MQDQKVETAWPFIRATVPAGPALLQRGSRADGSARRALVTPVWRRQIFSDLTGALTGTAQTAPSSPEFDPATRAANLAAQTASSKLPQSAFPGADQTMPKQLKKLPA